MCVCVCACVRACVLRRPSHTLANSKKETLILALALMHILIVALWVSVTRVYVTRVHVTRDYSHSLTLILTRCLSLFSRLPFHLPLCWHV